MKQFDKKTLIKDFILKDEERFDLAGDIFDNFNSIIHYILNEIQDTLIDHINDENRIDIKLSESKTMADYHYFKASIDNEYHIFFENYYYLKTYRLYLQGEGGFDKNNETHFALHNQLKTKNYDYLKVSGEEWAIVSLKNNNYETNLGLGESTRSILFDLLKDDQFRSTLSDKFNQIFKDGIVKIVDAVLSR